MVAAHLVYCKYVRWVVSAEHLFCLVQVVLRLTEELAKDAFPKKYAESI